MRGVRSAKAIDVNYTKKADGACFSEAEVQVLLNANAGPMSQLGDKAWAQGWRRLKRESFMRTDGLAKAKIHWTYVAGARVAKRVEVCLANNPPKANGQDSSDDAVVPEKGF